MKDGVVITAGGPFSISIVVNGGGEEVNQESHYRSLLNVTGALYGVYQYTVFNRAMPNPVTYSYNVTQGECSRN